MVSLDLPPTQKVSQRSEEHLRPPTGLWRPLGLQEVSMETRVVVLDPPEDRSSDPAETTWKVPAAAGGNVGPASVSRVVDLFLFDVVLIRIPDHRSI